MMTNRKFFGSRFFPAVIAFFLVGILLFSGVGCGPPEKKVLIKQNYGVPVVVATVKVRELSFSSEKVIIFRGDRKINVNFSLPGTVAGFIAKENDLLKVGDPIARLDMLPYKASLNSASLKLKELKKNKARIERFYKKRLATENEYNQINAAYKSARRQVEAIRENLEKAVLRSPVKGILVSKAVEVGVNVYPGKTIATIVTMSPMVGDIEFSDVERSSIPWGKTIELSVKGIKDKVFTGVISRKIVTVDPRTQMTRVEVEVKNEEGLIKPGMMAEAVIETEHLNKVVTIPFDALVYDNMDLCVYIYNRATGEAELRQVKTGKGIGKKVVVFDGIKPGEQLIVSGQGFLSDGMTVRLVDE